MILVVSRVKLAFPAQALDKIALKVAVKKVYRTDMILNGVAKSRKVVCKTKGAQGEK